MSRSLVDDVFGAEPSGLAVPAARPSPPPESPAAPAPSVPVDPLTAYEQHYAEVSAEIGRMYEARRRGEPAAGIPSLEKVRLQLLGAISAMRPKEPPSAEEEERRWKADAEACVKKIKAGVKDAKQRLGLA